MIAFLTLSLLAAPARAAVVALEPARIAPRAISAAAAAPLPAALAPAPALAASPAPAALRSVPAPALAAAAAAAPNGARAVLGRAAESGPEAGEFDGRSGARLRLLSAEELGVGGEPDAPRPPAGEPAPFLYRHYRLARFVAAPVLRAFYRVRVEGRARLPPGPALIVPNHVSFLDPVLVSFAANRPMRFLMYRPIYETRGLRWLFRALGAIPISTRDPKDVIEESLNRARRALAAGETVVIFPEGQVTRDGDFSPFRRGFERIARGLDVPVVPARVDGMWGSVLSRHPGRSWLRSLLARLRGRRRAAVTFGPPLARADADLAREAVAKLAR